MGIAAGPLPNSKWIEVYARLGYGLLTYKTVRTVERAAFPAPNLVFCGLGDPAVVEPTPRRLDPAAVTWAASFGLPSAKPEVWRADVAKARARLPKSQLLVVSVIGTPAPGGDGEQLARDYAQAARWAAEAGADVVEAHLSCPTISAERPQMVFEDQALAAHVVEMVRRAVGARPVVAKLGAMRSPRALHDLATALARWVDGFALVNDLQRRLVKPDGTLALPGEGRELAGIAGAVVWDHSRVQVRELIAWRKAGAWDRAILAVGALPPWSERARRSRREPRRRWWPRPPSWIRSSPRASGARSPAETDRLTEERDGSGSAGRSRAPAPGTRGPNPRSPSSMALRSCSRSVTMRISSERPARFTLS